MLATQQGTCSPEGRHSSALHEALELGRADASPIHWRDEGQACAYTGRLDMAYLIRVLLGTDRNAAMQTWEADAPGG